MRLLGLVSASSLAAGCWMSHARPGDDAGSSDAPIALDAPVLRDAPTDVPARDAPTPLDVGRIDVGMGTTASYCVVIFADEMVRPLPTPELIEVPAGRTALLCFHNRSWNGHSAMEVEREDGEVVSIRTGDTWNDPQQRCVGDAPSEETFLVRSPTGTAPFTLRCL